MSLPYSFSEITLPHCLSLRYATNRLFWVAAISIHGLFPLLNYALLEFYNYLSCLIVIYNKGQSGTREGRKMLSSVVSELRKY